MARILLCCIIVSFALAGAAEPPARSLLVAGAVPELIGTDGRMEVVAVDAPGHATAWRATTTARPPHSHALQLRLPTSTAIRRGDVLAVSLWLRTVASQTESGEARIECVIEQIGGIFAKEVRRTLSAGRSWQRFSFAAKSQRDHAPGHAQVCLRLGFEPQTIDIAGFEVLNHGPVDLAGFPGSAITYPGMEADAPWRSEALRRIENLRTGELSVIVTTNDGTPVHDAKVRASLLRHSFGFGAAISGPVWSEAHPHSRPYGDLIERLFKKVVPENDLKWRVWNAADRRSTTLDMLAWCKDRGIRVRGHTLVWPSFGMIPPAVAVLRQDPESLRTAIRTHVTDVASATCGMISDWDVVNESYKHHSILDLLGREEMTTWYHLAHIADPGARLFYNDWTMFGEGDDRAQHCFDTLEFLIAQGAPIHAVGQQGHFGNSGSDPRHLLAALDRFATLGLDIAITEFDIDTVDETYQAAFTRDMLILAYSHPAVTDVMLWGFWEGAHWAPDAALFRRDWTVKPNGQAWLDLVHGAWRSTGCGASDRTGLWRMRGHCGEYRVEVVAAGHTTTATANIERSGSSLRVILP